MDYKHKLNQVQQRISNACDRSGRNVDDVKLIAVTKYSSIEETKLMIEAGCLHVAENKMQDAIPKIDQLSHLHAMWHYIGHLQTNKVKHLLPSFQFLHSLDRLSLAKEICRKYPNDRISCFIQVNISKEETKSGIEPEKLIEFINQLKDYSSIDVCGLMTMAPKVKHPEETRTIFRRLREWKDEIQLRTYLGENCRYLSMGMSEDFEIAIEEGATHIRLGSVLTK